MPIEQLTRIALASLQEKLVSVCKPDSEIQEIASQAFDLAFAAVIEAGGDDTLAEMIADYMKTQILLNG